MKNEPKAFNFKTCIFYCLLCTSLILLSACGSGGGGDSDDASGTSSSGKGSVSFGLALQNSSTSRALNNQQLDNRDGEFECQTDTYEIATIEAQVVDQNEVLLAEGGPFDCEDRQGTINAVEAGDRRIVKVFAKDESGTILFRGNSEPVTVIRDRVADTGIITLAQPATSLLTQDDSARIDEDTEVIIPVDENDTESYFNETFEEIGTIVPDTLTINLEPNNGTAVANGDGTVSYTPNSDFFGDDSFTYTVQDDLGVTSNSATVTVAVRPEDDEVIAEDDPSGFATNEDTPLTAGGVLDNDSAPDGGLAVVPGTVSSDNGASVTLSADGTFRYDPTAAAALQALADGATRDDIFTYTATDVDGDTDDARVTVTVTGVDDPPVAVDNTRRVTEGSSATTINVLDNDTDIDGGPINIATVSDPAGGSVVNNRTNLTYTPDPFFCTPGTATDDFTYTLSPGGSRATVRVTVTCIDDPPLAVDDERTVEEDSSATTINVLDNDTDIDGGPINIATVSDPAGGSVVNNRTNLTYTPDPNFCTSGTATDNFTYTLSPGGSRATVRMTVTCIDDPPVAVDDERTVEENSSATTIDVLENDTDIDGGPISINSVSQPAGGTVVNNNSNLTYRPNANFCTTFEDDPDEFTYTLAPGGSTATVQVTVTCAINRTPDAVDDVFDDLEACSVDNELDVLANDSDPDGHPLIITAVESPTMEGGTVTINGTEDGLLYTPAAGFLGEDTFTYTITDIPGVDKTPETDTATVTVNVTSPFIRVSVDLNGNDADDDSFDPSISADGTFVAFESNATDLVDDDSNRSFDIFIRDRDNGTTDRVSVDSFENEANGDSFSSSINSDGLLVAFGSEATNLVDDDSNNRWDIFVRDRDGGTTERVSVDSFENEANGDSFNSSISSDGTFVAFRSFANNLVADDSNGRVDIFVRDRRGDGTTERVSVDSFENEANGSSFVPSISADGLFVAFASDANNLVADDSNDNRDIFVRDRHDETTERVSVDSFENEANGDSFHPSISSDGTFVAFRSSATNLVADDSNNRQGHFCSRPG